KPRLNTCLRYPAIPNAVRLIQNRSEIKVTIARDRLAERERGPELILQLKEWEPFALEIGRKPDRGRKPLRDALRRIIGAPFRLRVVIKARRELSIPQFIP